MKYGVCLGAEWAKFAKEIGFDYLEIGLNGIAAMSDKEFNKQIEMLKDADMPCLSMNAFFPWDMKIVGDIDRKEITAYMVKALDRAKKLGAKTVVFGSGRSRNIPEEFDRDKCVNELASIIGEAGTLAKERGIKIVIEPLNRNETNVANTVSEAVELAKMTKNDNVATMVDFYHFYMNGEDYSELDDCKDYIKHIHVARANEDRGVPNDGDIEWLKFVSDKVKGIGYDGLISVEAVVKDYDTEPAKISKLLRVFD